MARAGAGGGLTVSKASRRIVIIIIISIHHHRCIYLARLENCGWRLAWRGDAWRHRAATRLPSPSCVIARAANASNGAALASFFHVWSNVGRSVGRGIERGECIAPPPFRVTFAEKPQQQQQQRELLLGSHDSINAAAAAAADIMLCDSSRASAHAPSCANKGSLLHVPVTAPATFLVRPPASQSVTAI